MQHSRYLLAWRTKTYLVLLGCGLAWEYWCYRQAWWIALITCGILGVVWSVSVLHKFKLMQRLQQQHIPEQVLQQFSVTYPHIRPQQRLVIIEGFKDFIGLHLRKRGRYAMPSHAVDALWHIFLEYPEQYRRWCKKILGYELQHLPHSAYTTAQQQQTLLIATWLSACRLERLHPRKTRVLPRLFSIDRYLHWKDGAIYSLPVLIAFMNQFLAAQDSTTYPTESSQNHHADPSSQNCVDSSSSHSHHGHDHCSQCSSGSNCSSCSSGGGD